MKKHNIRIENYHQTNSDIYFLSHTDEKRLYIKKLSNLLADARISSPLIGTICFLLCCISKMNGGHILGRFGVQLSIYIVY